MTTNAPTDPSTTPAVPLFTGRGEIAGRSWWRSDDDEVAWSPPAADRVLARGHPAGYEASTEVVEAVNTALILGRPLLVTGRPGTGKTELAERIAYELGLGAVQRFESQSLSEANELFYRFDYIQQMVVAKLVELQRAQPHEADPVRFISFGALGRAILHSAPDRYADLLGLGAAAAVPPPRRSVVLIDEIDKTSRDFPNDLLNGIDRMRFEIRELGNRAVQGAGRDSPLHPVVVITSNSERDLPAPFLRRCVFVQIPDPDERQLALIVAKRVFEGKPPPPPLADNGLPLLYAQLLDAFVALRDQGSLRYQIGTSELLELSLAARRQHLGLPGGAQGAAAMLGLQSAIGAMAKHQDDREPILGALQQHLAPGAGA